MRKVNFMKAIAAVFFTVSAAFMVSCVDQDNSELKTPKSPDDPIIQPAKLNLNPDLKINELGAEATAELTVKADSGTFADKATVTANFKTTVMKDKIQITMDMLEKSHKPLGLNVTPVNNVTKVYSEDFAINDLDTIQAKSTIGMGVVLGHEFTMVVDSIKVTDWRNKTAEKPTAIVAGSKRVDYVPTEITHFCHEVGTGRTNNFKVVTKVQYTTWIPEDGIEMIGDYAKNVRRSVKNFIDTQYWTYVEKYKKGEETWENETNYTNSYTFKVETISLEDLFTTSYDLTQVKPNGISLGIESEEKPGENGTTYVEKTDIYSASRTIGGSAQNTIYRMTNRKIMWKKGSVSLTFGFIAPNVKEISDYMNTNNKSDREGYDMQVFENVVEIAYGVDSTGISKDRFNEQGKVYVKKAVVPTEVTVKSVDVKVTVDVDLDKLTETATAKGTITYSDNTTKTVDLTRTDNIKFDVKPAWTINGKEATQTTSGFGYKKTSSSAKTATVEGKDYSASWAYDAESWETDEKVNSNSIEKSNGTTLDLYNNYAVTVEGHTFKADAISISAASSNDHLTNDGTDGLTTKYTYLVNHTWTVGGKSKELHPTGILNITADDYIVDRHWYDIKDWDETPTTYYHIGLYTEWASGKVTKDELDLSFINGIAVGEAWTTTEKDATDTSYSPILTESSREDITKGAWFYNVVKTDATIENQLAGSKQYDRYVITSIDGVKVKVDDMEYAFPRRSVTATAQQSLTKVNDNQYSHANVLTATIASSSSSCLLSATAHGTINIKANDPEPETKRYGAYLGTQWCAALDASREGTIYGFSMRFEKGSIPGYVDESGNVHFSESDFEEGSFIYNGACINNGGQVVNCYTTEVTNYGLIWYRGTNDKQAKMSYDDLSLRHFNNNHNEFTCSKFGKMEQNGDNFSIPGTSWTWKY